MGIFEEALLDTGRLVPLLALIYFFIGLLEYRYGDSINHFIIRVGGMGPLFGALLGCIPQCGFSVVASALYVKRLISTGTLMAVFLSTSDEAVPILLSMPHKAHMAGLLITIKFVVAISAGLTVDLLMARFGKGSAGSARSGEKSFSEALCGHPGCCDHGLHDRPSAFRALLVHPLLHTVKIFVFLFSLTLVFNYLMGLLGPERMQALFLNGTFLQPLCASIVGLFPNCFASVLLAQLYDGNIITFGSMVAGLCAASGLGLMILFKENKDLKDTLRVVGILLAISVLTGFIVQLSGSLIAP